MATTQASSDLHVFMMRIPTMQPAVAGLTMDEQGPCRRMASGIGVTYHADIPIFRMLACR